MSDKITGNNTGVGSATDGNGGNNTNTEGTGQTQGGGGGSTSTTSSPTGPKNWKDEDKEIREKLKANQFGTSTVEWYQTVLNAFSYKTIKDTKTSNPNKDLQKIQEEAKNESLIKLQELAFILTLAMSKAASSAVDTALKAADKRYKKK
jgi:hypothetical protein